jgi:hypothetical protein
MASVMKIRRKSWGERSKGCPAESVRFAEASTSWSAWRRSFGESRELSPLRHHWKSSGICGFQVFSAMSELET